MHRRGRTSLVVCLFLLCASLHHAQNEDEEANALVVEKFSKFPSIVTVEGDSSTLRSCGGTLIGDHVVLTAAHCVIGVADAPRFPNVVLDTLNAQRINRAPETRQTVEATVYPGYSGVMSEGNDIALLRLGASVEPLEIVHIQEKDMSLGTKLVTIGAAGEAIRIRQSTVVAPTECEDAGILLDSDSMICISGEIPCVGDEGGPVLDAETGDLVAVVSMTSSCKDGSTLLAIVTLQNSNALEWIDETTKELEYSAFVDQSPAVIAFAGPNEAGIGSAPTPEEGDLDYLEMFDDMDIVG